MDYFNVELSHKKPSAHFNEFQCVYLHVYMVSSCNTALKEGFIEHKVYLHFLPTGHKK